MELDMRIPGLVILLSAISSTALAAPAQVTLTLKDHRFTPSRVSVPAGQIIEIELINRDLSSEEFDSTDLGVEADVTPKNWVRFKVGPLKAGSYDFVGEYHADTAQGVMVAVD
jgi:hypothetical protein